MGNYGTGGNLIFRAREVIAPANDDFENAFDLGTLEANYTLSQDTFGATSQTFDPVPTEGILSGRSVWFSYTATTNAEIVLTTATSNYNTILSIWTGNPAQLQHVASNDDQGIGVETSQISFIPDVNTTYYIMVSGYVRARGTLNLNAYQANTSPANDLRINPITIDPLPDGGDSYTFNQNTTGATISNDEPIPTACAVLDTNGDPVAFNNSV